MKIVGKNADGTLQSTAPYAPHTSAILELESINRGLLLPRLTTTQRVDIASPAQGLVVFDTTTKCVIYYDGADWISLCQGWKCGDLLVDNRDGARSEYTTKSYGTAGCWMTQNLRYLHPSGNGMRINGGAVTSKVTKTVFVKNLDSIHATTSSTNISYYEGAGVINSTREEFTKKFGVLYNWDTAMNLSSSERCQGVCPNGWHLPSDAEWNAVEREISNASIYGGTPETWQTSWETGTNNWTTGSTIELGRLMKSDSLTRGETSGTEKWSGGTDGGTRAINSSAFNGFPSGWVDSNGQNAHYFGNRTAWWTSSELNSTTSYMRHLYNTTVGVWRGTSEVKKAFFNIRCKKN